jgi:hypothetical protein
LGLVVNVIVLWNTLYLNKALGYLRASGMEIHDKDINRLTPLGFDHIRMTGRYDFTLTARPELGGLRPMRQA